MNDCIVDDTGKKGIVILFASLLQCLDELVSQGGFLFLAYRKPGNVDVAIVEGHGDHRTDDQFDIFLIAIGLINHTRTAVVHQGQGIIDILFSGRVGECRGGQCELKNRHRLKCNQGSGHVVLLFFPVSRPGVMLDA